MKTRSIERMLCILIAVGMLVAIAPHAVAQPSLTVPPPTLPGENQVIDFYAGGNSGDYSLQVSPQGGQLTAGDYLSMGLMPWGYVTTVWPTGRIYIIFLANVTQTDFRIGFLYLTNSSTQPAILRLFDYATANIQLLTFQGIQHVYNRTVSTGYAELPHLQIPAASKITNGISALGPQLYLNSNHGEWLNGTTRLNIYPVYNQYFTGAHEYNEVWSLLTDSLGNYYFAILYMPNSNKSQVIIEHQLRLNDYKALAGTTVSTTWTLGAFANEITVRTNVPNSNVTIDGFPFQSNQVGNLAEPVPTGYVTLEVPSEIAEPNNSKLVFDDWGAYGSENPLKVLVNSTFTVTAKFTTEYWVGVNSQYGAPSGSGWYQTGTNASFGVSSPIELTNATRLTFVQWTGDFNSTNTHSSLTVNSAKRLNAEWQRQYALTIIAPGLPANATAIVVVGDQAVTLRGPNPSIAWVAADQQVTVEVQNQHVQTTGGTYTFSKLLADNQTFEGVVIVTQPITVSLLYAVTPNAAPSLGIESTVIISYPNAQADEMVMSLLENGLLIGRSIPSLRPMISLTASLAKFGYVLATMLVPGGPPLAGYMLGSLFVGLIYILPISALALLYRSAKTGRRPSLRTLTPLAMIWIIAFALVLVGPNFGIFQSLLAALQILLMLATMLLFPLLIAFRLARLAA